MARQWPRRITRGPLAGQVFDSEGEYRRAHMEATGTTRYARRQARARDLGYAGYSERRRILRVMGVRGPQDRKRERIFLKAKARVGEEGQTRIMELATRLGEKFRGRGLRADVMEIAEQEGEDVNDLLALLYSFTI